MSMSLLKTGLAILFSQTRRLPMEDPGSISK